MIRTGFRLEQILSNKRILKKFRKDRAEYPNKSKKRRERNGTAK